MKNMAVKAGANPAVNSVSEAGIEKKRLKEACQEFEAILTGYLLKSMRQSVMRAEDPDQALDVYENMMDDCLAKQLSKQEDRGLAELLYRQLVPMVAKDSEKDAS